MLILWQKPEINLDDFLEFDGEFLDEVDYQWGIPCMLRIGGREKLIPK